MRNIHRMNIMTREDRLFRFHVKQHRRLIWTDDFDDVIQFMEQRCYDELHLNFDSHVLFKVGAGLCTASILLISHHTCQTSTEYAHGTVRPAVLKFLTIQPHGYELNSFIFNETHTHNISSWCNYCPYTSCRSHAALPLYPAVPPILNSL